MFLSLSQSYASGWCHEINSHSRNTSRRDVSLSLWGRWMWVCLPQSSLPLWPNLEWSRVEMAEPYDESSLDPWVTPGRRTLWRTTWSALNFIGARGKLLLCCTDKTLICYVEIARATFDSFFSSPSLSFLQKILIGFSPLVYWFLFFTSGSQGQ